MKGSRMGIFRSTHNAEEADRIVRDGDTVVFGGFVGTGAAEEIALELERFYLAKQSHRLQSAPGDHQPSIP